MADIPLKRLSAVSCAQHARPLSCGMHGLCAALQSDSSTVVSKTPRSDR